jgi:hypothetical protein
MVAFYLRFKRAVFLSRPGNIRNWDLIERVDLNPDKKKMSNKRKAA